jgi:hypothetical protein
MQQPQDLTVDQLTRYTEEINQSPNSPGPYHRRALLLCDMHAYDQAIADHRRSIELAPDDVQLHLALIETQRSKGDFTEAEKDCRRALQLHAGSARLWEDLGRILQTIGNFPAAADCFRQSLGLQPSGTVSALLSSMPGQLPLEASRSLTERLEDENAPPRDRAAAGFALGDILDQAGNYDPAFAAYARANQIFKHYAADQGEYFDGPDLEQKVSEMIRTFTPDYFQQRADFAHLSELPVFVVGMPRSGTSLVEQILASHSQVFGAGELVEIPMIRARLAQTVPADAPRPLHRHWHRHLGKVHAARLALWAGESALRVVDKLPGNILHLGMIATMLPQSRIIFCHRDPRDTCLSCYFQQFKNFNLMFSYDLQNCATQYLQQQRLEAHWQKVLPLRMLTVSYEELVSDTESQSRRLIDFLGLPWEPACLNFHQTVRPVLTKSLWQVRQPIYTASVGRWKNYQQHLDAVLKL